VIVAVHQPNYLPYVGFFDKMRNADIFVIYDDAQFNKGDFQHRNKIRIFHGWKWLTVPVEKVAVPINKIKIRNELTRKDIIWSKVHLKDIRDNYKDAPYYTLYEGNFERIYTKNYNKLIDLNMEIINFLMDAFNIKTKLVFSSEFGFTSKSTERLVMMVEALDGDVYLSGSAGREYIDVSLFENTGIEVEFQDFSHPIYKQHYGGFISNMSAIDVLFNIGEIPKE